MRIKQAIHEHALAGDLAATIAEIDGGVPMELPGPNGSRPLHYAATGGQLEVIAALLARGADVNAPDENGRSPVARAELAGQYAAAIPLLEAGGSSAGLSAASLPALRAVVAAASEEEALRGNGMGGLIEASEWGLIEQLIDAGFSADGHWLYSHDPKKYPPSKRAFLDPILREAPDSLVEKLADRVTNLEVALGRAAARGQRGAIRILLGRGAKPNEPGLNKETALFVGLSFSAPRTLSEDERLERKRAVLEDLVAGGASVHEPGLVHKGVGNVGILEWFKDRGASFDVEVPHLQGTPVQWAVYLGYRQTVQWFIDHKLVGTADPAALLEATAAAAAAAAVKRAAGAAYHAEQKAKAERAEKRKAAAAKRAAKAAADPAAEPAKPAKAPKAAKVDPKTKTLRAQIERLGLTAEKFPGVDLRAISTIESYHWLHFARSTGQAYRANPGKGVALRGIRFCVPFTVRSDDARALFGLSTPLNVIGHTPEYVLGARGPTGKIVVGRPQGHAAIDYTVAVLLKHLSPDPHFGPTREVPAALALPPVLELQILWGLALAGICDLQLGGTPPEALAQLKELQLRGTGDLSALDARFASLECLHVRTAHIADLTPLTRLPALRRLAINTCVLDDPSPLAQLTELEELHLPGCRLDEAQLTFLRELPKLRAVTLGGNIIDEQSGAWMNALPEGLPQFSGRTDEDRKATSALGALGERTGALVLDNGYIRVPLEREGAVYWHALKWPDEGLAAGLASWRGQGWGEPHEKSLLWWPRTGPAGVIAAQLVPDEIIAQLKRLGVTFDESLDINAYPTATTRLLARAIWPRRRELKNRSSSPIHVEFFVAKTLRRGVEFGSRVVHPGMLLGLNERLAVMISDSGDADPNIFVFDLEHERTFGPGYRLSKFLGSLS